MKKKAEFPLHLLNSRMNDINRRYVDEYIEVMRQQGKSERSIENYSIAYDRVFRFAENWNIDFRDYNESIFDTFVIAMLEYEMSDDRINFITSSISTLAEYLKDKYPDKFGRYFLKGLERLEAEKKRIFLQEL
nr:hypothetical protein [Desulforamulus aquiferis]